MGAAVIEKHITVDRGMEGNDHKVSLLPDEFAQMTRASAAWRNPWANGASAASARGK